ncbi:hypothetical protein AB0953_02645 [Streptomyces sp. NPDC046866]|uniref:hypothetical protein n=1 Tax=Streptomyces sp. NPDC046866 TaxID=3154921 RepID=UPI0034545BA6
MSEAEHIRVVPDTAAEAPEPPAPAPAAYQQLVEAAGGGPGVGVAALVGYAVGQVADVAKTYIVETNATERARIEHGQSDLTDPTEPTA